MDKLVALSTLLFVAGCPKSAPPSGGEEAPSYDPATSIVVELRGDLAKDKLVVSCAVGEKTTAGFDGKKAIAENTSGTCNAYFMPGGTDEMFELKTGRTYSCGVHADAVTCQPAD